MTILRWDVPKKVKTVQQWRESYGFDGGPDGGYQPNMSEADKLSWKAKITGKKLGYPQVEIRKTTERGSQVVIIVNLGGGYNYKYYRAEQEEREQQYLLSLGIATEDDYVAEYFTKKQFYPTEQETRESYRRTRNPTRGINIHIATNGPIQMTFDELADMQAAIEEAKVALTSFL